MANVNTHSGFLWRPSVTNEWEKEQRDELRRLCRMLPPDDKVARILLFLGQETIAYPSFRATQDTLFIGALADEFEKANLARFAKIPKGSKDYASLIVQRKKCDEDLRNTMVRVREHLELFYAAEGIVGRFRIELPKTLPRSPMKGRYGMLFKRLDIESASPSSTGDPSQLRLASSFWTRMLASEKLGRVMLVYPIMEQTKGNEITIDGLHAGSGEVAAGVAIGACLPHLWSQMDIKRSCDIRSGDLRAAASLILLGSAIDNSRLEEWRDEMLEDARWPPQAFLTGESEDGTGEIRKVGGKDSPNTHRYSVEREHGELDTDYALLTHFRDKDTGQSLVALQGISTVATRAIVEFMATDKKVRIVQKKLGIGANDPIPSFEMLFKVTVRHQVYTQIEYLDHELAEETE